MNLAQKTYHTFRHCVRVRSQINYFTSFVNAFDNPLQKVPSADTDGLPFCQPQITNSAIVQSSKRTPRILKYMWECPENKFSQKWEQLCKPNNVFDRGIIGLDNISIHMLRKRLQEVTKRAARAAQKIGIASFEKSKIPIPIHLPYLFSHLLEIQSKKNK